MNTPGNIKNAADFKNKGEFKVSKMVMEKHDATVINELNRQFQEIADALTDKEEVQEQESCGRCRKEAELVDAPCEVALEFDGQLGIFSCAECGTQMIVDLPHPKICRVCLAELKP